MQFLHNDQFFAAAQKKYVYIYDKRGIEVHCLKVRAVWPRSVPEHSRTLSTYCSYHREHVVPVSKHGSSLAKACLGQTFGCTLMFQIARR